MKTRYIAYLYAIMGLLALASCKKDSLLNQQPPSKLTEASYWHTTSDLKNYMNNFYQKGDIFPLYGGYGNLGIYSIDGNSDNMVTQFEDGRLNSEYTVTNNSTYANWSAIRDVNYFLANYSKVTGAASDIADYVGEAYFFRAVLYFNAVQNVGGVPWVNKVLNIDDINALNAPRLPRNVIVDSVVNDLNKAIANLPTKAKAQSQRVYKEYAQGMKARICLYEGTWEKYHANDVFGVSGQDGSAFLQQAADAANAVITSGTFQLDNAHTPNGYFNLFNKTDYTSSKEVMFWGAYNQQAGVITYWQNYFQGGSEYLGLSKTLIDDYLCTDGKPISVSALYKGDDSLGHIIANRDPRLRQTIFNYGDTVVANYPPPNSLKLFTSANNYPSLVGSSCTTGFQIKKGLNTDYMQDTHFGQGGTDGVIYMRYAEILLIHAEARAELGLITQSDLDLTINTLRDRVGMPHLNLGSITTDPKWAFPQLSPVINEIRRERRVELACEGFRLNDILRWAAAGTLIVHQQPLGAKAKQFATVLPGLVIGTNLYVNAQGYIEPYAQISSMASGYNFNVGRDYLLPLPLQETVVNPAIKQNPGWQ